MNTIGPDYAAEVEAYQRASEEMENLDFEAAKPALAFLLTRIGSWTSARWDQHLRHEMGDEKAECAIRWIEAMFHVKEYGEQRADGPTPCDGSEVKP